MERLGALRKLGLESRGATTRCTGANPSMVRYGKRATLGTLRSTSPATAADSMTRASRDGGEAPNCATGCCTIAGGPSPPEGRAEQRAHRLHDSGQAEQPTSEIQNHAGRAIGTRRAAQVSPFRCAENGRVHQSTAYLARPSDRAVVPWWCWVAT